MNDLRTKFIEEVAQVGVEYLNYIVVAVDLPSRAVELITNTMCLEDKLQYYIDAYDDDFQLKTNKNVQIIGYMLV